MPNELSPSTYQDYLWNKNTYGTQKIEGLFVLEHKQVSTEDELSVGDTVEVFVLPDGRYFLSKAVPTENTLKIEKITPAYIFFETDIQIEEK